MKRSLIFLIIFLCFSVCSLALVDVSKTNTTLVVDPPDGKNGWYTYVPLVTLFNSNVTPLFESDPDCLSDPSSDDCDYRIVYHWDMVLPDQVYAGPINGTEDPATGGISTLHYHAEDSNGNTEPDRVFISKVDFTPPSIRKVYPEPDSVVYSEEVVLSAYFEEFFQSNSGIDLSSLVVKVDGVDVPFIAHPEDIIDASVESDLENLTVGNHTVYIYVEDNAGNFAERSWSFRFTHNPVYSMDILSPLEGEAYSTRRVPVNVSLDDDVYFLGYSDNGRSFIKLCNGCIRYERLVSFSDGNHVLLFVARAGSEEFTKEISFLVDTKKSKIIDTSPDFYTTGNFSVTYTEANVEEVRLFWKFVGSPSFNEVVLDGCPSGNVKTCSTFVDFGVGEDVVEYYFVVSDPITSVQSKLKKVVVDTKAPVLTVFDPEGATYEKKSIPINLVTSEVVKMISYSADGGPFRSLCIKCDHYDRAKPFSDGKHNITFKAVDYAGNSDEYYVEFEVDSMRPRIHKTYPDKYTNGTFWVVYTEDDLQSAALYFDGHSVDMDCPSGRKAVCSVSVDLSAYDGMLIDYYFRLSDKIGYITSPLRSVWVDVSKEVEFEGASSSGITPII